MKPISIYIHWPFCLSLCPYCDFNSHVSNSINHNTWLEAYKKELSYFADRIAQRPVRSIFFGGGTPSLMEPNTILGIIAAISDIAMVDKNTEITLEANPTSYELEKFKEFKAAGINRVSIGVQSLRNERLQSLGRKHSAQNALDAIKSAATLFDKYSFDLMYATQNQNLKTWQDELKKAMEFAGGHISLYQLTIEKGTPFFKLYKDKKLILPSNDEAADMYEWTNEYLQQNQYKRYEISNYAVSGHECLHNLCYWNYDEYIGIGPGAHSRLHNKEGIVALMMANKPNTWLDKVNELGHGIQTKTQLSKIETIEEVLMMGTRLQAGIVEEKFQEITGKKFLDSLNINVIEQLRHQNFVTMGAGQIKLSEKGLLLHSYIVPRMLL
ncbi:MAG: radical SAM family heme chaperone HemW [Rickettsiaceae bacterium]|nr:radical SAM family heme chaperone HemW [Rickettsiaceae bacterium]